MQILNVFAKKTYVREGYKKIKWSKVGFLKITDSGNKYLNLFLLPHTEMIILEKEPAMPVIQAEEEYEDHSGPERSS